MGSGGIVPHILSIGTRWIVLERYCYKVASLITAEIVNGMVFH